MGWMNQGKTYAGLTGDPDRRKAEHGHPLDWRTTGPFSTELEARSWEKAQLAMGRIGGTGGAGWRHGYLYTITATTVE